MSDAFRNQDTVFGIPILRAGRDACPVCQHPTGDCAQHEDNEAVGINHIAFTDSTLETMKDTQTVLVEENIYEDRQITPFTKARVIVHHKGSYVTVDKAKELGILD
jgi:hypothetical protein